MKKYIILFLLSLTFGYCSSQSNAIIKIGDYDFQKPDWWDKIQVTLPDTILTQDSASAYISAKYGSDVGTPDTWKSAMKCWVIFDQRTDEFPVYIAHCYKSGGELEKSAKVYIDLFKLIHTAQPDLEEWYTCYLAYSAGEVYAEMKDVKNAEKWYSIASQPDFLNSAVNAVSYYAKLSLDNMNKLKEEVK